MRIAVVGGYGVAISIRLPRFPKPGETVGGQDLDFGHGGKGSNQAIAAARLGARSSLFTAVGSDDAGRNARALWAAEGVDGSCVVTSGSEPTMTGVILVEPSGENSIVVVPGALGDLGTSDVERFRTEIRRADMLVVSFEVPPEVGFEALRIAREEGTATLLNPAPARPLPDEVWAMIDVITPNRIEAAALIEVPASGPPASPAELSQRIRSKFSGAVVMTLGADGVLLDEGGAISHIPSAPVERLVDTTGAGDAFTAALAVALCAGRPLPDACAWAAAAGAHTVAHPGVIAGLAYLDELESELSARTLRR